MNKSFASDDHIKSCFSYFFNCFIQNQIVHTGMRTGHNRTNCDQHNKRNSIYLLPIQHACVSFMHIERHFVQYVVWFTISSTWYIYFFIVCNVIAVRVTEF